MTRQERSDTLRGLAFLSPWVLGFCLFTAVPVGLSLYYSFCDYALTSPTRPPLWVGLANYKNIWHDELFWKCLRNTFYFASISLPAGVLVSLGLAIMLNAKIRNQTVYRTIVFLPSLVPAVASAMIWKWMYNSQLGLFNHLLSLIGITGPNWLGPGLAMPALAFMSVWGVGNTVVIYLAGLQDVPRELLEASEIDGAGPIRRLFSVTLPILSPVIFFQPRDGDHRYVLDPGRAVHHDRGRAQQRDLFLHHVQLRPGVPFPAHGLRERAGVDPAVDRVVLHGHRVLVGEEMGSLCVTESTPG